ncbi:MAG: hypothetical protein ACRECH_15935 [Nitrososphaerales archaeon]
MTKLIVEAKNRTQIREALPEITRLLEEGYITGSPINGAYWRLE